MNGSKIDFCCNEETKFIERENLWLICIKENQAQSYFYLCGIKPIREVKISEGITLMPATSTPNPDDMIDSIMKSNHASEVELGVLIATLRMTTSQIRIEGAVGKELAVKTWNVQQICVMMSAILNCDLAWYFQAVDQLKSLVQIQIFI